MPEGRIPVARVSLQYIWEEAVPFAFIPVHSHPLLLGFGSAKGHPSLKLRVGKKACAGSRQEESARYFTVPGCMCAKQIVSDNKPLQVHDV